MMYNKVIKMTSATKEVTGSNTNCSWHAGVLECAEKLLHSIVSLEVSAMLNLHRAQTKQNTWRKRL